MNKDNLTVENGGDIQLVVNGRIDKTYTYRLKPLPLDTPLKIVIELINAMKLNLHLYNKLDIEKFINDHPELVE